MNNRGGVVTVHNSINVIYLSVIRMAFNILKSAIVRTETVQCFCEGPRSRCYGRTAALRLIVQPFDEDDQLFAFLLGMKLTGERRITRGKTCLSVTLSTTNHT